jgi:hypothetical protein
MLVVYLVVCIVAFSVPFINKAIGKRSITSETWSEAFTAVFLSLVICALLGCAGEWYTNITGDERAWEAQYGDSHRVVVDSANSIEVIDYNGEVYYRFVIVNEEGLLEVINTPIEYIEKIEICGVKPTYIPIEKYKCIEPCFLKKWFGNYFVTIKNEKKAKGKLVIDEDIIIKSLTYKLVEE